MKDPQKTLIQKSLDESTIEAPGRRKLLFAVASGGILTSLPSNWSKPVVDAVILPAHAQTSPGAEDDNGGNGDDNGDDNGGGGDDGECKETKKVRLKFEIKNGKPVWTTGVGANDCIQGGFDEEADGATYASLSGDVEKVTITLTKDDCVIDKAAHKEGQSCVDGSISGDGQSATFSSDEKDISNGNVILECCVR